VTRIVTIILCVLLPMAIGACAEKDDGSSVRAGQTEIVEPSKTSNVKQMEEYEKAHPPSKEKRIMPMPGTAPEQNIDSQFQGGKVETM